MRTTLIAFAVVLGLTIGLGAWKGDVTACTQDGKQVVWSIVLNDEAMKAHPQALEHITKAFRAVAAANDSSDFLGSAKEFFALLDEGDEDAMVDANTPVFAGACK